MIKTPLPFTKKPLTDQERLAWLRLIRSQNVGPRTFLQLLRLYGSASAALEAIPELSRKGGRAKPITPYPKGEAEREIAASIAYGASMIAACEPDYPDSLLQIDDFPPVISVLGRKNLLQQMSVGIVGSRDSTTNGCRFAYKLAADLGKEKLVVASGLARGIDTAAHKGALESGTVAVIAGGIDSIYPPENKDLYQQIAEKGAIIAELPIGATPKAMHFPQRNRIISGMSYGIVVIEAGLKSGSLITANMALNQNREVFAVPGFPLDPRCQGTNSLIKQGAILTESAKDIIEAISYHKEKELFQLQELPNSPYMQPVSMLSEDELEQIRKEVIQKLGPSPLSVDELIAELVASPALVLTVLLELELAERLQRHAGNKVSLLYAIGE